MGICLTDNSKKIEQLVELKDGRIIYKTDNGFTSWVESKGKHTKVTNDYYKKAFKNRIK